MSKTVCVLVFLSLLLLFIAVPRTNQLPSDASASDSPASELIKLTDIPVTQITGLSLKSNQYALGLIPEGTKFEVLGGDGIDFDSNKLAALVYTACHLSAEAVLETPDPLSDYGLQPPRLQISLLTLCGDPVRLFIGDSCPVSEQVYARLENTESVFLLSSSDASLLLKSPEDLRDMSLFPHDASIDGIAIENSTGSYALQRKADSVSGLFRMVSPVSCDTDWQLVSEKIHQPLQSLIPDHFVTKADDLSAYHLDKPDYQLLITSGKSAWLCRFAQSGDGDYYCCVEGNPAVYRISEEKVNFLNISYTDLIGSSLYRRSVSQVSRISLSAEGKTYTIEFFGSSEALRSVFLGKGYSSTDTQKFYNLVTAIPMAGELTSDASPSSESLITLTIGLRDGGLDILEFYPMGNRYCALSINGEAQFATYSNVPILIASYFLSMAESGSSE